MKIHAILLAIMLIVAPSLCAQPVSTEGTDMQALRTAAKTDKKALVASTLELTPAQAKKFWPLYDSFQRTIDAANRQRAVSLEQLLSNDKPMSNLAARNLARNFMAAEETEMKATRKMFNAVMRALPQLKAARYIQLENKISTIQAFDIAGAFPLVK